MKLSLALTTLFAGLAGPAIARGDDEAALRALRGNELGNGNPKQGGEDGCKKVFQFNMIGHPRGADIPACNNEGKRIFVVRGGQNSIPVYVGGVDEADVLDDVPPCNNFDIRCSSLSAMLTNSDYEICTPDIGTFDVSVRILGKPGGELDICVNDLTDVLDGTYTGDPNGTGTENCLIGEVDLERKGKSKFTVKSQLFADKNQDVLWGTTTNDDFRIAQFTFWEKGCF